MGKKAKRQRPRTNWMLLSAVAAAVVLLGGLYYYFTGAGTAAGGGVTGFSHIHGLGIDPGQPAAIWLATHDGLLRREADGRWRQVGTARPDLMGFSVSMSEPGVLYSSGHPGPGLNLPNPVGLIISRDGGGSWQPVSLTGEVDFHAMAVSAADPRVIFGWFGGRLFLSEDQGASWLRAQPPALASQGGPLQLAAHPRNPDVVAAATPQGLLSSRDRGNTWEMVLTGLVTAVSFLPGDPAPMVAYQAEQGLIRSTDDGLSWAPVGYRAAAREDAVAFIAPHPQDPRALVVATFQRDVARTVDGGATWETLARGGKVARR